MEQAGPFMIFAAIAAGTPGPANVLVTATGAAVGVVRGIPCLLGVSVGTGAFMDDSGCCKLARIAKCLLALGRA